MLFDVQMLLLEAGGSVSNVGPYVFFFSTTFHHCHDGSDVDDLGVPDSLILVVDGHHLNSHV